MKLEQCVNSSLCLPEKPKLVVGLKASTAYIFVDNAAYRDFLFQKFEVSSADMESSAVVMVRFLFWVAASSDYDESSSELLVYLRAYVNFVHFVNFVWTFKLVILIFKFVKYVKIDHEMTPITRVYRTLAIGMTFNL